MARRRGHGRASSGSTRTRICSRVTATPTEPSTTTGRIARMFVIPTLTAIDGLWGAEACCGPDVRRAHHAIPRSDLHRHAEPARPTRSRPSGASSTGRTGRPAHARSALRAVQKRARRSWPALTPQPGHRARRQLASGTSVTRRSRAFADRGAHRRHGRPSRAVRPARPRRNRPACSPTSCWSPATRQRTSPPAWNIVAVWRRGARLDRRAPRQGDRVRPSPRSDAAAKL